MIGEVVVMKPEDFEAWREAARPKSMAANGEKYFQSLAA